MDIKQKRQRFNILLHYGQMMDAKEHILSGYGVDSTTELTETQLDEAITSIQLIVNQKDIQASKNIRSWRHKCLRMINACGVDTNDWNSVNEFMLDSRISGKHLYELTADELATLHRKLQNVKANIDAKREEIIRLQTSN